MPTVIFDHPARKWLRIVALVISAGAAAAMVFWLGITRTELGRDALLAGFERQFAETFDSRLEIETLTGKLRSQFFAKDLRLYDAHGHVVLHVDSVVVTPHWRDLFKRRFSAGSIQLIRPTLFLRYEESGTWNVVHVFTRKASTREARTSWSFTSADVRIEDGRIRGEVEATALPAVEAGWLFDPAGAEVRDVDLRATVVWEETGLIDVFELSFSLSDLPLDVRSARAQLVIEPDRLLLNQLYLDAGETVLQLAGSMDRRGEAPFFEGTLTESRLDFEPLGHIVPRIELADAAEVSLRFSGSPSHLLIDEFRLARGQTDLKTDGTFRFHADSTSFDVTVGPSVVNMEDLRALAPTVDIPVLDYLGKLSIGGTAQGRLAGSSLRSSAEFTLRSVAGSISGTASLSRRIASEWEYEADLVADSLDLGLIVRNSPINSDLRGPLRLEGRGFAPNDLRGMLTAQFETSRVAGRQIDSLRISAAVEDRRIEATIDATLGKQSAVLLAHVDASNARADLDVHLATRDLDLGAVLGADSLGSRLTSTWSLEGAGSSVDDFRGTLVIDVDSSDVQWGTERRHVLPHRTVVTVHPPSAVEPRITIAGDLFAGEITTSTKQAAWRPVAGPWIDTVVDAIGRYKYQRVGPVAFSSPESSATAHSIELDATLSVERADILTAALPMLPSAHGAFSTRLVVYADSSSLRANGTVTSDSFAVNSVHADRLNVDFGLQAGLAGTLEHRVSLIVDADAERIGFPGRALLDTVLEFETEDESTRFAARALQQGMEVEDRIEGRFEILEDRNRLTVEEIRFALGGSSWHQQAPATIDFLASGVHFSDLRLESATANQQSASARLRGSLSDAPSDTLFLDATSIDLKHVSDFVGMRYALGGRLDGQIALSWSERPFLTGSVSVDTLSVDGRAIGRLDATSRYLPGTPDIALSARLTPTEADRVNNLAVDGTLRLPSAGDPGTVDLKLDIERLDAFFVEYILRQASEVHGGLAGTGSVSGTFDNPIIEADLALRAASVEILPFGLHYAAEGHVQIDGNGIHFERLSVADPSGGTADIEGSILFNNYRYFSLDLDGRLRELQIINVNEFTHDIPFYGSIQASGDASLRGPLNSALLRSYNVATTAQSKLFIPIREFAKTPDPGFILFADSLGRVPEALQPARREHILVRRAASERTFVGGLEINLDISAPPGSTVNLVIDPQLGDVITAVGSGSVQLQLREGFFRTFGSFDVDTGDYLFTAGKVFARRFLIDSGTITWTGEPVNPELDIQAAYRTRASRTGLPEEVGGNLKTSLPLIVHLDITGALNEVLVDLRLSLDRSRQEAISDTPLLEAYLNRSDRAAQHATSVLVTNSFLLSAPGTRNAVFAGSAFNSVSALVSSQLNRYLSEVIPNADFTFGVQSNETAADLDVSAGIALRLLNERLLISGQGVYRGFGDQVADVVPQGLQGEFVVEIRLSPTVSIEVFYRREGDVLSETLITSEAGAGLSYNTEFIDWSTFFRTILGRSDADSE